MRKSLIIIILIFSFSLTKSQDTISLKKQLPKNPKVAMFMSAVIPGSGQIYNGKYFKVPIIYGAAAVPAYFGIKSQKEYKIYRNDILLVLNDTTNSPNTITGITDMDLLELNYETWKKRRDLSILAGFVIWTFNIVDAYVDAELSNFDISDDLSVSISPNFFYEKNSITYALSLKFYFY